MGAGLGILLLFALVTLIFACLQLQKHKRGQNVGAAENNSMLQEPVHTKQELDNTQYAHEMNSRPLIELAGDGNPAMGTSKGPEWR